MSDNMNNLPCNCTTSPFTNPNYVYIVTGDIYIVQDNKLKKLVCKGPKLLPRFSCQVYLLVQVSCQYHD